MGDAKYLIAGIASVGVIAGIWYWLSIKPPVETGCRVVVEAPPV